MRRLSVDAAVFTSTINQEQQRHQQQQQQQQQNEELSPENLDSTLIAQQGMFRCRLSLCNRHILSLVLARFQVRRTGPHPVTQQKEEHPVGATSRCLFRRLQLDSSE